MHLAALQSCQYLADAALSSATRSPTRCTAALGEIVRTPTRCYTASLGPSWRMTVFTWNCGPENCGITISPFHAGLTFTRWRAKVCTFVSVFAWAIAHHWDNLAEDIVFLCDLMRQASLLPNTAKWITATLEKAARSKMARRREDSSSGRGASKCVICSATSDNESLGSPLSPETFIVMGTYASTTTYISRL